MRWGRRTTPLTELAEHYGILTEYRADGGGIRCADPEVLVALLGVLGAELAGPDDAAAALAATRGRGRTVALDPVLVHWTARPAPLAVAVPKGATGGWVSLELEHGEVRRQPLAEVRGPAVAPRADDDPSLERFTLDPGAKLTHELAPGYHRLRLEAGGLEAEALLVAAGPIPAAARGWGVFCPIYALRTEDDLGVGSYRALGELAALVGDLGASMVATLPLYPAFPGPPVEASPYLPLTKLGWNELYVDPTALPELEIAPEAARVLASPETITRLASARRSAVVEHDEVLAIVRRVLEPMSRALRTRPSARRSALEAFAAAHPELVDYARFRATAEGATAPWWTWAERAGRPGEPVDEDRVGYHLYAQWVAHQQLGAAAREGGRPGLYLDFPIGVHPEGFDPWWVPGSFVRGAAGGAPPDRGFPSGQYWAFPPVHPEGERQAGYRYTIAALRHAFASAAVLRLDHVMGLRRLYWIPDGFDPAHGAYVRSRPEELRALVAVEAGRAGAAVVGEDLGTVPAEVRTDMAHDGMLRSWVFEFAASGRRPLPDPPEDSQASLATHDLATFAGFWAGLDIDEAQARRLATPGQAGAARRRRAALRRAVLRALDRPATDGPVPRSTEPEERRALVGCLDHLAAGPARLVLVDLFDVWGERQPHNRPGTGAEALNWRRRAPRTVAEIGADAEVRGLLAGVDRRRRGRLPTGAGRAVASGGDG